MDSGSSVSCKKSRSRNSEQLDNQLPYLNGGKLNKFFSSHSLARGIKLWTVNLWPRFIEMVVRSFNFLIMIQSIIIILYLRVSKRKQTHQYKLKTGLLSAYGHCFLFDKKSMTRILTCWPCYPLLHIEYWCSDKRILLEDNKMFTKEWILLRQDRNTMLNTIPSMDSYYFE